MLLTPYGNLNKRIYPNDRVPSQKITTFRGTDAQYANLYETWFEQMRAKLWPTWDLSARDWDGDAKTDMEDATEAELTIMMEQLQTKGVLRQNVVSLEGFETIRNEETGKQTRVSKGRKIRNHLWHFDIEDARLFDAGNKDSFDYKASKEAGSNFLAYVPDIDIVQFEKDFWTDNRQREPQFLAVKLLFQRPRPWTAAWAFGMHEFDWYSAERTKHTGVHPAFPSGHCYQGMIHSSNVLQNWLDSQSAGGTPIDPDVLTALKHYAVGWGDRRVFAGVHYPTDNIASWIFALRVAPFMFDNATEIEDFIKDAIMNHSLVYQVIQSEFPKHPSLAPALELLNENFPSVGS